MPDRLLAVFVDPFETELFDAPAMLEEAGFALRRAVAVSAEAVLQEARGATVLLTGEAPIDAAAIAELAPPLPKARTT